MLATFAALTEQTLEDVDGPDSFNVLSELLGEPVTKPGRDHLVEQGRVLALREGPWKFIPGTNGKQGKKSKSPAAMELYHLANDLGETTNLAEAEPKRVKSMSARLESIQSASRSRPE
jgi:arylsulfatase A-like enzyme